MAHSRTSIVCVTLLLAACAPGIRSGDVTEITVNQPNCERGCVYVTADVRADGSATYGDRLPAATHLGKWRYSQIVQMVLSNPAVQRGSNIPGASGIPMSSLMIRTRCCGRRTLFFPTYPALGPASVSDPARALNMTASYIIDTVDRAVHTPLRSHLRRWNELREVTYSTGGSLCIRMPCGYELQLNSGGMATLKRGGTFTARVPFRFARDILSYDALWLDEYYPPIGEDAGSSTLTLTFADGWQYRVFAPDRNTWPPQLREIDGAFSQLVRDTGWHKSSSVPRER